MSLLSDLRKWRAKLTPSKASLSRDNRSAKAPWTDIQSFSDLVSEASLVTGNRKPLRSFRLGRYYFGRLPEVKSDAAVNSQPSELSTEPREFSELPSDPSKKIFLELPVHQNEGSISELPAHFCDKCPPLQELPSPSSMTPMILDNSGIYELDSGALENFAFHDTSMDLAAGTDPDVVLQACNKEKTLSTHDVVHQALDPVNTPACLPKLQTDERLYASPSLISANESPTASLVSPVTPILESARQKTQQPEVSPIDGTESPHQFFSHSSHRSSTGSYDRCHVQSASTFSEPEPSVGSFPTGAYRYPGPIPGTGSGSNHQHSYTLSNSGSPIRGFPQFQQFSHDPSVSNPSAAVFEMLWHGVGPCTMSNDHHESPSAWYRTPFQNLNTVGDGATRQPSDFRQSSALLQDFDRASNNSQPQNIHFQPDNRDLFQTQRSENIGRTAQLSPKHCNFCEAKFTGKYGKGNLARHVRDKHGAVKSTNGKVCRVCYREYNRADAKKKHEWEKHHLEDARPKKRRKEEWQESQLDGRLDVFH